MSGSSQLGTSLGFPLGFSGAGETSAAAAGRVRAIGLAFPTISVVAVGRVQTRGVVLPTIYPPGALGVLHARGIASPTLILSKTASGKARAVGRVAFSPIYTLSDGAHRITPSKFIAIEIETDTPNSEFSAEPAILNTPLTI